MIRYVTDAVSSGFGSFSRATWRPLSSCSRISRFSGHAWASTSIRAITNWWRRGAGHGRLLLDAPRQSAGSGGRPRRTGRADLRSLRGQPIEVRGVIGEWPTAEALWQLLRADPRFQPILSAKDLLYRLPLSSGTARGHPGSGSGHRRPRPRSEDFEQWERLNTAYLTELHLPLPTPEEQRKAEFVSRSHARLWWGAFDGPRPCGDGRAQRDVRIPRTGRRRVHTARGAEAGAGARGHEPAHRRMPGPPRIRETDPLHRRRQSGCANASTNLSAFEAGRSFRSAARIAPFACACSSASRNGGAVGRGLPRMRSTSGPQDSSRAREFLFLATSTGDGAWRPVPDRGVSGSVDARRA